ncbi:MAG: hypothetical protein J6K42_01345 [Clostridia bacterium]|nr:hypothetical protein [Clostridia bacterium]
MGTYYLPRDTKGEGRILYIFSTKALIYTVVGIVIGALFKWLLGLFGKAIPSIMGIMNIIGIILIILFAVLGFVIGTCKVPAMEKFEITRKAAGIEIDTVIKEYIRFSLKKDKYYTYDTRDLIKEQLEKEELEKAKLEEEKRKENK